jgi:hypothetical protein
VLATEQTPPRGTQTLTWVPLTSPTVAHCRSAAHVPAAEHAGAQYESPPSCAQMPPPQSLLVTHGGHAVADASTPPPLPLAPGGPPPSGIDVSAWPPQPPAAGPASDATAHNDTQTSKAEPERGARLIFEEPSIRICSETLERGTRPGKTLRGKCTFQQRPKWQAPKSSPALDSPSSFLGAGFETNRKMALVSYSVRSAGSPAVAGAILLAASAWPSCGAPRGTMPVAEQASASASATAAAASSATPDPSPPEPSGPELPRGGRTLFPDYELVGFCGTPGGEPVLGRLSGNLPAKSKMLLSYAEKYAGARKILPVFELIAVVVQSGAGSDGKYRRRVDDSVVDQYLASARASKGILLLNIQPGQSDFLSEVRHYEKYLHEPDVGVALDPEWSMKQNQPPGKVYGQTTGEIINDVAALMSSIVEADHLPEKALVFHQVDTCVVKNETVITPYPGVATIKSVDGLGPKHTKITTYNYLKKFTATGVHPGFKLFFDEDTQHGGPLMTPAEVLGLAPPPEYVMYE